MLFMFYQWLIGDACIKANTDLTTVKKRLNQNPIEVIQLLARSIAKGNPASNKKKHTNKSMRKVIFGLLDIHQAS